jgi:hypothetical protein
MWLRLTAEPVRGPIEVDMETQANVNQMSS